MPARKTTTKKKPCVKTKTSTKKKSTTHCGVSTKVVKEYGICDVACTSHKKKKCGFHKTKK